MARIFTKKGAGQEEADEFEEEELPPMPKAPPKRQVKQVQEEVKEVIVEREVTLTLLNEKLNYLIELLNKAMAED